MSLMLWTNYLVPISEYPVNITTLIIFFCRGFGGEFFLLENCLK